MGGGLQSIQDTFHTVPATGKESSSTGTSEVGQESESKSLLCHEHSYYNCKNKYKMHDNKNY